MKTPINNRLRCLVTFITLFILFGCDNGVEPNYLLRCTFEADQIGAPPDKLLPGDPIGDILTYPLENDLEVIPTPYAPQYKSAKLYEGTESINFFSRPASFAGTVTFRWHGTLVDHTSAYMLENGRRLIEITDELGHKLVRLKLWGTHLSVEFKDSPSKGLGDLFPGDLFPDPLNPEGSPNPDYDEKKADHIIIINVKYSSKVFDLTIFSPTTFFSEENIPLYDPNVVIPASVRPTLSIRNWDDYNNGPQGGYILDEVLIWSSVPKTRETD